MMDIAALRPSQVEQLIANISDQDINDILEGVADLLDNFESDGGADSDKIYMAAQLLSMTPIWSKVDAEALAAVLLRSDVSARAEFLKGLPHEFAKNVSYLMETSSAVDPLGGYMRSQEQFHQLVKQQVASMEQLLSIGNLGGALGGEPKVSDEVVFGDLASSKEIGGRVEELLMRRPLDVAGIGFCRPMMGNFSPAFGALARKIYFGNFKRTRHEDVVIPILLSESDEQ